MLCTLCSYFFLLKSFVNSQSLQIFPIEINYNSSFRNSIKWKTNLKTFQSFCDEKEVNEINYDFSIQLT